MTQRQLYIVLLRVLAVWLFITSMSWFVQALYEALQIGLSAGAVGATLARSIVPFGAAIWILLSMKLDTREPQR